MTPQAQRDLDRMRRSPSAWSKLRYERATGPDGHDCDRNAVLRARVLWALQYDRRREDLPLLRWVVEQEAACRREAPFQGLSEQAELAGFLLAEHRQVEDVWLQWSVKDANFDTQCGYDAEHVVAGGVESTIEFVRDSDHAERGAVLDLLVDEGRPRLNDMDLEVWFEHKRTWFPTDPAEENPITWVARSEFIGDNLSARRHLDRWSATRERDQGSLRTLVFWLATLGDFTEAARAQRESVAFDTDAWDAAGGWLLLAELERNAGEHHAAWRALRECERALVGVPNWREVGLGRSYVEELFRLAAEDADDELAETVFASADQAASAVPRLGPLALDAAADAAERTRDHQRSERYRAIRDAI